MEISDLAQMCGVSQVYFRKLFKLRYGTSPKQYINALRLETAAQLLQSQLYSVGEVSEKSGFTDPKYFTKRFTKRFGCGPKQYQHVVPEKNWK
jgi:AraC-like DNA-binding protein